jgi:2-carboxy-1,4-naphthoquinone phytyltransferase
MTAIDSPRPSKSQLWLAAIKPPMYSVAIVPICVGTAMATAAVDRFDGGIFALFLGAAIAIIAWINISNDVYDSDTGIDINKAESVVNLTGNRDLMLWIGNTFLLLGLLGIGAISWLQQDITVIAIVCLCCFLGYTYQGPPFRLGYQGLGEIICWLCFGPLALAAAYYSQTQSWSLACLVAATIVGTTTTLILFCSHFHQVKDDLAAGKKSPIVRLGTARGAKVLTWAVGSIYLFAILGVVSGYFPALTLSIFLSAPIGWKLVKFVRDNHDKPEIVRTCKYIAVRLHAIVGLLFALGLVVKL